MVKLFFQVGVFVVIIIGCDVIVLEQVKVDVYVIVKYFGLKVEVIVCDVFEENDI